MSCPDEQRDRWFEDELQNVSLPPGLIARLKAIAQGNDQDLDGALCNVSVPQHLTSQLKAIAQPAPLANSQQAGDLQVDPLDASLCDVSVPGSVVRSLKEISKQDILEEALCGVPIPPKLCLQLHEIAALSDSHLDALVSDVSLPAGLSTRLKMIKRRQRLLPPLRQSPGVRWAIAASLMISLGLAYLLGIRSVVLSTYPTAVATSSASEEDSSESLLLLSESEPQQELLLPPVKVSPIESTIAKHELSIHQPIAPTQYKGAVDEITDLFANTDRAMLDLFLPGDNWMAAPTSDSAPELTRITQPAPRGLAAPQVKGYNLLRLLQDGIHPFTSPTAHKTLTTSRVPLVATRDSYEATWNALAEGRLLDPSQVRTEDFLAGISYQFPKPTKGNLAIRTAAGPSPFGEENTHLLQVGVQTRSLLLASRKPQHFTIAVDVSASMAREHRLDWIRFALLQLAEQLRAEDRISLIAFNDYPQVLLSDLSKAELPAFASLLGSLNANGNTNLATALETATRLAAFDSADSGAEHRLVLMTDGISDLPRESMVHLEQIAARTAQANISLDIIHVGSDDARLDRLQNLARSGKGSLRHATGSESTRYAMLDLFAGESQLVARNARLKIRFNPRSVARYRLLGHEPDGAGGLTAGSWEADVYAGQVPTALFELQLHGGSDDIGVATLSWVDPKTNKTKSLSQRISRVQFATSLLESPLSLQKAALAAETAEILRQSPYAPSYNSGLTQVLEVAEQVHPLAADDSSLTNLLTLVELLRRHRSGRETVLDRPPMWWWAVAR